MIELARVPFGRVLVTPAHIGMITPAESDPYQGTYNSHHYGCCLLVQGEEIRVRETLPQVQALIYLAENNGAPPPALLADPVPMESPKKGKKRGGT